LGNEAVREFIDLNVDELSLVDKAANEEIFVVIKSLNQDEENNMADKKDDKVQKQDQPADDTAAEETKPDEAAGDAPKPDEAAGDEPKADDAPAEGDEPEKAEAGEAEGSDEAVTKAMDRVANLVESIVNKGAPESDEADDKPDTDEEGVEKAAVDKRALFEKQLKAAGMKGDAVKKAMAEYDKAFPAPVKKADDTEPKPAAVEAATVLDTIQKAIAQAQTFTPERSDQLLDVAKQLQEVVNGITGKVEHSETQPKGDGSDMQAVAKAVGELVAAFKDHVAVSKSLTDRMEQIEQVHNPSTSVDEEGETDKEEKTEKSFWAGVL